MSFTKKQPYISKISRKHINTSILTDQKVTLSEWLVFNFQMQSPGVATQPCSLHSRCSILLLSLTVLRDHTVLEVEMINGCAVVVDDNKLVDAAELSDQRWIEVRLNPADEIIGTRQRRLHGLSFWHKETEQSQLDTDVGAQKPMSWHQV